ADPDVLECFRRGDQTADACQRAVQRFPDIGHFADDIRFTLGFCQALGNPGGCVPTVKSAWNFPTSNPGGSSPGADSGTAGPGGGTKDVHIDSRHGDSGGGKGGYHTESLKLPHHANGPGKYRFATGALKLQQGGGANASTGVVKTSGIKATGIK